MDGDNDFLDFWLRECFEIIDGEYDDGDVVGWYELRCVGFGLRFIGKFKRFWFDFMLFWLI